TVVAYGEAEGARFCTPYKTNLAATPTALTAFILIAFGSGSLFNRRCCMPSFKISRGDWVIVCDGTKALILENTGDEEYLNLKTREVYEQPAPKTHEIGTDAPGRTMNSVGGQRSAMDQTDWHDQEEQRFLHGVLGRLDAAVNGRQATSLIMVAPPRALGVL